MGYGHAKSVGKPDALAKGKGAAGFAHRARASITSSTVVSVLVILSILIIWGHQLWLMR